MILFLSKKNDHLYLSMNVINKKRKKKKMSSDKVVTYAGYIAILLEQFTNIPQIYKNFKLKDTNEISLVSLFLGLLSSIIWAWYGWKRYDRPLMLSGLFAIVTYTILILQKYMYP